MRALALVLALVVAGCSSGESTLTVATTRNVDLQRLDTDQLNRGLRGKDGRFWLLFIPFGSAPTLAEAMNEALEAGAADALVNVRVRTSWISLVIFSREAISVEGDGVVQQRRSTRDPQPLHKDE